MPVLRKVTRLGRSVAAHRTSWRVLLLAAVAVASFATWIDRAQRDWNHQHAAATEIADANGHYLFWDYATDDDATWPLVRNGGEIYEREPTAPAWLRWLTGNERIGAQVVAIRISDDSQLPLLRDLPGLRRVALTELNAKAIEALAQLPALESLEIEAPIPPHADVRRLPNLARLKRLEFHGDFTPQAMRAVTQIRALENLKIFNSRGDAPATVAGMERLRNLRRLELHDVQFGDEELAALKGRRHLETLRLTHTQITDASLPTIASFKKLKELGLNGSKIGGYGIAALSPLTQLESLDLGGVPLSDMDAKSLRHLSHLKKLVLSGSNITDAGLASLSHLNSLEELSLAACKFSNRGLLHLEPLLKLTALNLCECNISGPGTKSLSKLTALRELNLEDAKFTSSDLRNLRLLPNLEILNLQGTQVGDSGLMREFACTRLKNLNLRATSVSDTGVARLAQFSELQSLDLSNTKVLGTGFVCFDSLPKLTNLSLQNSWATGLGLNHLAKCRGLSYLCLSSTPLLAKPLELQHIVGSGRLSLDLSDTPVGDDDLRRLAKTSSVASLEFFELDLGSTRVTDRGVQHLRGCGNIGWLNLNFTEVSDASVDAIATVSGLSRVSLRSTQVTEAGVARLKAKRPDLLIEFTMPEFGNEFEPDQWAPDESALDGEVALR